MDELKMKRQILQRYKTGLKRPEKEWPYDIRRGLYCLNKHLFLPGYSVNRMREVCNITDRNYSSRFRNYVGMTPRSYLTYHRVRAGIRLLEHEELNDVRVNDVGFSVGYEKPSSFTMIFKRKTGYTPMEWKQEQR